MYKSKVTNFSVIRSRVEYASNWIYILAIKTYQIYLL